MSKIELFEKCIDQREDWFVQNRFAYQSKIETDQRHLPSEGRGLDIGVGSGLFTEPLGILSGVEPSVKLSAWAAIFRVN